VPTLFEGEPMKDTDGTVLNYDSYVVVSGPPGSPIRIDVSPNLGDTTGTEWLVRFTSPLEIGRATVGFRGPIGAQAAGQMEILGCDSVDCTVGALGPYVDPAGSMAEGPQSGIIGSQDDVIYLTVRGSEDSVLGGGLKTLNYPDETIPIAVVKIGGTATPFVAPVVTFEGADAVASPEPPIDPTDTGLPPIDPLTEVEATGDGQQSEDVDGDLIPSSNDNCPFVENFLQDDNGGFKSALRNEIGDNCECGEVTGDGQIFGTGGAQNDVQEMQRVLSGTSSVGEADERCSVAGDAECDLLDLWNLNQALTTDDLSLLRRTCPTATPAQTGSGG